MRRSLELPEDEQLLVSFKEHLEVLEEDTDKDGDLEKSIQGHVGETSVVAKRTDEGGESRTDGLTDAQTKRTVKRTTTEIYITSEQAITDEVKR